MHVFKPTILALCIVAIGYQQGASANPVVVIPESFVVNRVVAGVLANRIAVAEGFAANDAVWLAKAANDPIYKATMAGVSKQLTSVNIAATGVSAGFAIAGAPVWLTLAATLGVMYYGANYVSNTATINIGNKGQVTITPSIVNPNFIYSFSYGGSTPQDSWQFQMALRGAKIYRTESCYQTDVICNIFPLLSQVSALDRSRFYFKKDLGGGLVVVASTLSEMSMYEMNRQIVSTAMCNFDSVCKYNDIYNFKYFYWEQSTGGGQARLRRVYSYTYWSPGNDGVWTSSESATLDNVENQWISAFEVRPQSYLDLNAGYPSLSSDHLTAPVPPEQIAYIAEFALRRASADLDYQGMPYLVSKPITKADVQTWTSAHPGDIATLGDMMQPAATPGSDVVIDPNIKSNTSNSPDPGTGSNPGANPNQNPNQNQNPSNTPDLGPDPQTPSPTLEDAPDASTILKPITSLFPELRSFQTPSHQAECPKPVFNLFGKQVVMDSQCTIAEQYRSALGAVMLVVWLLVGLFILLSA